MIEIGQKLLLIRKQKGMTQKELARKSGLCEMTILNYENGKVDPSYNKVEWILEAMGYRLEIVKDDRD